MASGSAISFHFNENQFNLQNRKRLKLFIGSLCRKEGIVIRSIKYIFCTDNELLEINKKFLHHDYYTDIISFKLSDGKLGIEAEIYISIDRIKENSRVFGVSFKNELHRVIFHGVLHICGYDDKKVEENKMMREKEDYYLHKYFT